MKRELSSLILSKDARDFETKVILIEDIKESPTQARTKFKQENLRGLAKSIESNGVLQPLVVQIAQNNTYRLIAGERRLRAAKIVGLDSIPCIIKDVSKRDAACYGSCREYTERKTRAY